MKKLYPKPQEMRTFEYTMSRKMLDNILEQLRGEGLMIDERTDDEGSVIEAWVVGNKVQKLMLFAMVNSSGTYLVRGIRGLLKPVCNKKGEAQ
jgi:hypothetical protein